MLSSNDYPALKLFNDLGQLKSVQKGSNRAFTRFSKRLALARVF